MKPQDFVIAYMSSIDVPYSELFKTVRQRNGRIIKKRTYNGVHLDLIRMSLAYVLRFGANLQFSKIALVCGYSSHSSAVHATQKADDYLLVRDPLFLTYYEKINELWHELQNEKQTCISRL